MPTSKLPVESGLHRARRNRARPRILQAKLIKPSVPVSLSLDEVRELRWIHTCVQIPDADTTVLVSIAGESEPVWLGFHDGVSWRSIDGSPFVGIVYAWADLPVEASCAPKGGRS